MAYFDDCKTPTELGALIKEILDCCFESNVISDELIEKLIPPTERSCNHPTSRDLYLITLVNKARQRILDFRTENPQLPPMPKKTNDEHKEPHKVLQEIQEWCIEAGSPEETGQKTSLKGGRISRFFWKLYEKTLGVLVKSFLNHFYPK